MQRGRQQLPVRRSGLVPSRKRRRERAARQRGDRMLNRPGRMLEAKSPDRPARRDQRRTPARRPADAVRGAEVARARGRADRRGRRVPRQFHYCAPTSGGVSRWRFMVGCRHGPAAAFAQAQRHRTGHSRCPRACPREPASWRSSCFRTPPALRRFQACR